MSPDVRQDICLLLESLGIYVSPHRKDIDIGGYANLQKVLQVNILEHKQHVQMIRDYRTHRRQALSLNAKEIYQQLQLVLHQYPSRPLQDIQNILREQYGMVLSMKTIKRLLHKPPHIVRVYQKLQALKKARQQESEKNRHMTLPTKKSPPQADQDGTWEHNRDMISLYEQQVRQIPLLSRKEEEKIWGILQQGGEEEKQWAKQKLVESNLRLVVMIAKKYHHHKPEIDLLDLVQAGNVGLIEAAERFNPQYKYRFITYASYWIRQEIQKYYQDHGRTIRLPVYLQALWRDAKKVKEEHWKDTGKDPTEEELAEKMNIPQAKLKYLQYIPRHILELPTEDEHDFSFLYQVPAPPSESGGIDLEFVKTDCAEKIKKMINESLSPQERTVLTMRFGLDGHQEKTLGEIGDVLHMTREGIRLIEIRALKKLRQSYPEMRHLMKD